MSTAHFCHSEGLKARSRWVRVLSSGVLLYGSLGDGWVGILLTLLASAMTYAWSLETISSPVAIKLSHLAITSTWLTGTLFAIFTTFELVRIYQLLLVLS